MKAIKKLLVVAVAGATLTACCGQCDKPKFDAKEYAKHKTERIDKIVELTDAQQSEVYALYLEQGKEMKKNIKAFTKECANMKQPDCKKAECGKPCPPKPECKKGECNKAKCEACPKKAECKKGECNKPCAPKCDKPCPKKAECDKAKCKPCPKKAECDKAKCDKPCAKKAECKKGECNKPCAPKCDKPCPKKAECDKAKCEACPKKAECKKGECDKPCAPKCDKPCPPKPECGKPMPRPHRPELVSPESKRATFEKLGTTLTPEQNAKLKEHYAKRHACRPDKKACTPCATVQK